MDALDLLYKHYNDTNTLRLAAQERRNKEFAILCVLEALSFLVLIKPEQALMALLNCVNSVADTTLELGNGILQTLLWVLLVYIQIRYVSDMLYVEKQYCYQAALEKQLSQKSQVEISREGDNYIKDYPIVLNLIDLFYKMLCPVLFEIINIVRICYEWKTTASLLALILDTVFCASSFIIMWFYFFEIHSKITAWFKKCTFIDWCAKKIRKILKEV